MPFLGTWVCDVAGYGLAPGYFMMTSTEMWLVTASKVSGHSHWFVLSKSPHVAASLS